MTDQTAAAGWYPQEDGRQRYWDGEVWTDHFAPGAEEQRVERDEDAIWQVRGKPLSGMGAGRYKLTQHYLMFETGTLRTDSQQIPIAKVLDVDVKQSMSQKARGVANILVHVERPQETETVTLADVPEFREGQRLINETAHQARRALQQHANTMRYEHSGAAPSPMDPSLTQPTGGAQGSDGTSADPIEQLERLGKLRDAGVVTDEEFQAKKAEILSRI